MGVLGFGMALDADGSEPPDRQDYRAALDLTAHRSAVQE